MSTLKADAVTSAQDNTALTLSGTGTGGVKVNDFFVQTKGADISSATSLTLGKDGNQFDVTGTTTITSIATQSIGSYVTLHFDGALTFTHHSTNLILPGGASITTAAGDIAVMYEYASADWRCVSYSKASGAAVVAGSGTHVLIGTAVASSSASLTITGLSTTYDSYLVVGTQLVPEDNDVEAWIRFGDSSGIDTGSSDYAWGAAKLNQSLVGTAQENSAAIMISGDSANTIGSTTGEYISFSSTLHITTGTSARPSINGTASSKVANDVTSSFVFGGNRAATITVDRILFQFQTGNIITGRLTVWGIAHA